MEGLGNTEEVKAIRKRAIRAGLKLVDCPIRHLGTEKAQELYYAIERHLLENGVEILFGYECTRSYSWDTGAPPPPGPSPQ